MSLQRWILKDVFPGNLVVLSSQEVMDCDTTDEGISASSDCKLNFQGCNGGWPQNAFQFIMQSGGVGKHSFVHSLSLGSIQSVVDKFLTQTPKHVIPTLQRFGADAVVCAETTETRPQDGNCHFNPKAPCCGSTLTNYYNVTSGDESALQVSLPLVSLQLTSSLASGLSRANCGGIWCRWEQLPVLLWESVLRPSLLQHGIHLLQAGCVIVLHLLNSGHWSHGTCGWLGSRSSIRNGLLDCEEHLG